MTGLSVASFAEDSITALLFEQRGRSGQQDAEREKQIIAIADFVSKFICEAKTSPDIALYHSALRVLLRTELSLK